MAKKPTYEELEQGVKDLDKKLEGSSKKKDERFDLAIKGTDDGIWDWEIGTDEVYQSPRFKELLGYQDHEIDSSYDFWESRLHPDDQERVLGEIRKHLEEYVRFDSEYRLRTKTGEYRWFSSRGQALWDENGQAIRMAGSVRDITERKLTEETLRKSEEKYRSLVESTEDSIYLVDREGTYLFMNKQHLSRLGSPADKVIGKTYGEFHSLDNTKEFVGKIEEVFETGEAIQHEHRSSRDDRYFLRTLSPVKDADGNTTSVTVISKDITERNRAEKALVKSETFLNATGQIAKVGGWEIDGETKKVFWTKEIYNITEVPNDYDFSSLEKEAIVFFSTKDQLRLKKAIQRAFEHNEPYNMEFPITTAKGNKKWVQAICEPIFIDGEVVRLSGTFQDITDGKQAQDTLRESEERLTAFMESATDGFILFDSELNHLEMNKAALEITGLERKDVIGKNVIDTVPNIEETARYDEYKKVMKTGVPFYIHDLIFHPLTADKHVELKAFKVGDGLGVIFTDITERKQAEEERTKLEDQLHRAQRMESMGLMAGGIAHDLNNILSGIVSYPELLLMDIPVDSPMRKPMETIMESGMRAADVVTDLMTIARGVAISKEVLNFNTVVEEYLNSTEHKNLVSIRPSVTFKTQFDSDLLNVNGSPTHIKKTLMNLTINATEAIEGSGTVTISTMNQYLDEPLRGYEDVVTGEYVVLTVSDDGSGISQQDLERIFEPFYTKKVMDRSGTGLGLAVVWNTVQDHNGYIDVMSSRKGTVFELYFPVTREEVAAKEEEVPTDDYLGHGEKILVVDDEERQREIATGILTRLGYTAEAVSSGEDAIEYVKEHPVDLIVLDMVMPKGINGRKTYEEIIKIRPGQKAIIASGYAKTLEVDFAQAAGAGKYIKKPYTLEKVGLAVKEELEK